MGENIEGHLYELEFIYPKPKLFVTKDAHGDFWIYKLIDGKYKMVRGCEYDRELREEFEKFKKEASNGNV